MNINILKLNNTNKFLLFLLIVLIVVISFYTFRKETYMNMSDNTLFKYVDTTDLNQRYNGLIGTRKDFANLAVPFLNPVLVPVVPSQTE